MTDRLVELLLGYGVLVLVPILFFSAMGVPMLPATILLVAAGAFASVGELSPVVVVLGALLSTWLGNALGYSLGRRGGEAATTRWARRLRISESTIARAEGLFARYGGLTVLLTRFPLSPLSATVNLIAGAAHFSPRAFVAYNAVGVTVWVAVYFGLGYLFGASWESLSRRLNSATQSLTLLVVVALVALLMLRYVRHRRARRAASVEVGDRG